EDGRLTERLYAEYNELNLSQAPRITHVSSTQEAMTLLKERRFDLVMTMVRLEDTNVNAFGRMVKSIVPDMPVVLLIFNESDVDHFPGGIDREAIDYPFVWRGDARILLTIIKLIEDKRNIDHDIKSAGVRCIIVVEDSVSRYSSFLTMLYSVVMSQSNSLISEGLNDLHKIYRMRARPKIVLATSYEEAVGHYERYKHSVLALISDVNFPKDGKRNYEAGFELAAYVHRDNPNLEVLLQSALERNEARAREMGLMYVDKNSPHILRSLRNFLIQNLGFGTFIFKMPDGEEIARAQDLYDMERIIMTIPPVSLEFHATRHHLSSWFCARSLFVLGDELRSYSVSDFKSIEDIREFLLKKIKESRDCEQQGLITDYSSRQAGPESLFVRMGRGSIGGKGRGIAFLNTLFARARIKKLGKLLPIRIPKSVCFGTDEFERFMESNHLSDVVQNAANDAELIKAFLKASLSDEHWEHLRFVLHNMPGPLAVRSSSILEDSHIQPFAGIYATYMIPNNHADHQVRFKELRSAIKAVYASLYSQNARSYIANTPHLTEEESMAVVIQQVVGQAHGHRYYPLISGVAQSYNYYPIGHQKAQGGIAQIAMGLGYGVVSGGSVMRFSPSCPEVLPQYAKPEDYLKYSQKEFYALDLSKQQVDFMLSPEVALSRCQLEDAEQDKTLQQVGSVYHVQDHTIRDNFGLPGPRVITFNNILKWRDIPLAEVLAELLDIIRQEAGFAVEVEFALDVHAETGPALYVLQMRPLAMQLVHGAVETVGFDQKDVLCRTDLSLGHGVLKDIRDIVYVKPNQFDGTKTRQVAEHIGRMNSLLQTEGARYFLIGPGRWGSSDPSLGIPVEWSQISGARLIAETSFRDQRVEPSQGTHFLQNIVARGVGYLTLSQPVTARGLSVAYLDWDWLEQQTV
ncbi:MAG TPA: PEP/pyruvate-binding domain-containing protein, partial [bacterium]|nr:PEP/pyruvate-binding domain-containing protein [bacterium]